MNNGIDITLIASLEHAIADGFTLERVVLAESVALNGYTPKAGDTIDVIDGSGASVKFATATVDGFKATSVASSTGVSVKLSAS